MKRLDAAASIVVAAAFVLLWVGFGSSIVDAAMKKDFLNLYVGATLAADGRFSELHDQSAQFELQRRFDPDAEELWPFVRPPFYAALLSWLTLWDLRTAFWIWVGLQTAVLLALWAWAAKQFGVASLMLSAMYLPTALGIAHGQDCVLMLAVAVAAYSLYRADRPGWAGATAALTLFKFHIWLGLPLALWAAGERRMLRGWLSGAAALTVGSMLLAGPRGVVNYVELLTDGDLQGLHPSPERTISMFGVALNLPFSALWVTPILALAVIWLARRSIQSAPAWSWWAASVLGSLLVVPHVYGYDAGIALLPIWLVFAHGRTSALKLTTALCATPLPYFIGLADPPLAAVPGLALSAMLGALAWENAQRRVSAGRSEPNSAVAEAGV